MNTRRLRLHYENGLKLPCAAKAAKAGGEGHPPPHSPSLNFRKSSTHHALQQKGATIGLLGKECTEGAGRTMYNTNPLNPLYAYEGGRHEDPPFIRIQGTLYSHNTLQLGFQASSILHLQHRKTEESRHHDSCHAYTKQNVLHHMQNASQPKHITLHNLYHCPSMQTLYCKLKDIGNAAQLRNAQHLPA